MEREGEGGREGGGTEGGREVRDSGREIEKERWIETDRQRNREIEIDTKRK